jgi:UDP-galactopyranose mutase
MDLVVVGAGFYGLTVAFQAAQKGQQVLVIEKRNSLGGNAHSYVDEPTGIEIHKYGSHLFHTSNARIWKFVNKFSSFNNYRHKVFTQHKNRIYSLPINLHTINQFFSSNYSPEEAQKYLSNSKKHNSETDQNAESRALSLLGNDLYEAFYKGYTQKQWQIDPKLLPAEIISRLPVRFNYNSDYFNDKWQGLPNDGYHKLFERMINHDLITIVLGQDFFETKSPYSRDRIVGQVPIVYTGPIDLYYNYCFGPLTWRTLDFAFEYHDQRDFQGTSVMNYADLDQPFTRIHEFKHLHPERSHLMELQRTIIAKEYSRLASMEDEPYYPVNSAIDRQKYLRYRNLGRHEKEVYFGGRLGSYRYLDMHMAIGAALTFSDSMMFR